MKSLNKGFNAPRFIESFYGNMIPEDLYIYFDVLKQSGNLGHIRLPGGTVSQDYFPSIGGGGWVFPEAKPLIDYIPVLKKLEVPVLWVANLLYPNQINETIYALNLLHDNGIKVIGVELGNEIFAHKDRHGIDYWLFIDRTDKKKLDALLSDMKSHAHIIKTLFPHLKIAVPVAKQGNPVLKRWNEEMFKLNVDAFAYHVYIDFGKESEQLKNFGGNIKTFKAKGKEVWITEYNMQFNKPSTNWINYKSPEHLVMVNDTMPKMFYENGATIISRHSLLGNDKVSPFFQHITINPDGSYVVNDKIWQK